MGYGRFSSYRKVRDAVGAGMCQVSVNHFRPHRLAHSMGDKKWQMQLLYYQKVLIPFLLSVLGCALVFPMPAIWAVPTCLLVLATSYFFDLGQPSVLAGLVIIAAGMTFETPAVMVFGAALIVAYACNLIWWRGATRIVRRASLRDKATFDSLWSEGVLLIATDDVIYSIEGEAPRNFTPRDVKEFMDSRKR